LNLVIIQNVQGIVKGGDNKVACDVLHPGQAIRLRDRSTLRLRNLRIDDRERLRAFFASCSQEAIRFRFLSSIKAPSDSLLDYLSDIDGYHHVALIVTRGFDACETIVAEGRYAVFREQPSTADIAFIVLDEMQRRGIATLLLQQLSEIASRNGVCYFSADVLADNLPMLSLIRKTMIPSSRIVSSGVIHFEIPLVTLKRDRLPEAA
jgi:GNAT superfamily N-acetyltransferase